MTLAEFKQLSKAEQAQVINRHGVFVDERTEGGNRIYLYMVNYFYVELLHELSNLNNKGITISNIFDDMVQLDAYVQIKEPVI